MAAFDTNLVAIKWVAGRYEIISQTIAHIDSSALAGTIREGSDSIVGGAGFGDTEAGCRCAAVILEWVPALARDFGGRQGARG